MITGDRALEIEERLAGLAGVKADEIRDYLHGYIDESSARRTGWRFARGTHGGSYVPDPDGTDILPRGYSIAS